MYWRRDHLIGLIFCGVYLLHLCCCEKRIEDHTNQQTKGGHISLVYDRKEEDKTYTEIENTSLTTRNMLMLTHPLNTTRQRKNPRLTPERLLLQAARRIHWAGINLVPELDGRTRTGRAAVLVENITSRRTRKCVLRTNTNMRYDRTVICIWCANHRILR